MDLLRYVEICSDQSRSAEIFQNLSRSIGICKVLTGSAGIKVKIYKCYFEITLTFYVAANAPEKEWLSGDV